MKITTEDIYIYMVAKYLWIVNVRENNLLPENDCIS